MNWKNKNKSTFRIGDIIILVIGLFISLIVLLCSKQQTTGNRIEVTANGTVTTYSLMKDQTISISSGKEGYNEIVIRDGKANMKEANCNDQICVRHKAVSKNGESIICLPHAVYVEVISDEENEIDN